MSRFAPQTDDEPVFHGGTDNQCCGDYDPHGSKHHWFRCGACERKCCWCFGIDSELRSFLNICCDCWYYATQQAEEEGFDPEQEALEARLWRHERKQRSALRATSKRQYYF